MRNVRHGFGHIPAILRFLRTVLLVDLGIFVAVGLVCWFCGWGTVYHWANGLRWAGVTGILFGMFAFIGGSRGRTSLFRKYARTAGGEAAQQRLRRDLKDRDQSSAFFVLMLVVGIVSFGLGTIIQTVLG